VLLVFELIWRSRQCIFKYLSPDSKAVELNARTTGAKWIFCQFLLLCMHFGLSIYSMYNVNVTIHLGVQFLARRSLARSFVRYLLPRRRKMRASHLHVKSDKTSTRFTMKVMRHFSHFVIQILVRYICIKMWNLLAFLPKNFRLYNAWMPSLRLAHYKVITKTIINFSLTFAE